MRYYYYNDFNHMDAEVLAFFIGILAFFAIILLAYYVVFCIGIMKMMKAKDLKDIYRAWIPVWNIYMLGLIIEDEVDDNSFVYNGTRWMFLVISLLPLLFIIPVLPWIAMQIGLVYIYICTVLLAGKHNTIVSMIISNIFGLPGIGFMIIASKMEKKKLSVETQENNEDGSI
jgi:hypothetical protein